METYFYLTVYPMEAMIASQLDPEAFGAYMAIGDRKGSAESLMFLEVNPDMLGDAFDLEYATRRCVAHSDGRPKHSVYLSVYRALEATPGEALGNLWLVTRDGRGLKLTRDTYRDPEDWHGTALYQELCPAHPLVVSSLNPKHFAEYIVEDSSTEKMPSSVFADLSMPDLDDPDLTGNTGGYFVNKYDHLKSCVEDLQAGKGKLTKVVNRSAASGFNYQVIGRGVYVGGSIAEPVFYHMPSRGELKKTSYDWAKSAQIF